MADQAKTPTAPGGATPGGANPDSDLLPQDQGEKDVLFQAQMAVANFFLGYYKYGIGILGLALLVALISGIVTSVKEKGQRSVHAQIAAVQHDLTDPDDKAALAKAAKDLEEIAVHGDGTAAVMALLQAADVFRAADLDDDALRAYDKANALNGKGILGWAAASGLATQKAKKGDAEGAIAIYKQYSTGKGIEAEDSLWALAVLFEDGGKKEEARQALQDLTTRFPDTRHAADAGRAMKRLGV